MYGLIVRKRVEAVFESLSHGDWDSIAAGLAEDVHHIFPGDHPLGGERHTRAGVLRWFERLGRLYPGHDFEVHRIMSGGWPWDIWIVAQWTAHLRPQLGEPYANDGTHWIRVRRGRVVYFHAYLDTQLIATACQQMAEAGVAEAAASPIVD
ncbi:MAG TPA: nuclear transport factor 2 family protein [Solirubrobacterales bacterium]|jgi:ketosteroid isomerase-like protein